MVGVEELGRGAVAQRPVRAGDVVDNLPVGQLEHGRAGVGALIELLRVSALRAFHLALSSGLLGGRHEEADVPGLAEVLELGRELAAAIDLEGADGKGERASAPDSPGQCALVLGRAGHDCVAEAQSTCEKCSWM